MSDSCCYCDLRERVRHLYLGGGGLNHPAGMYCMYASTDAHHGAVAHLVHLIDGRGYLCATRNSYVILWDG